MRPALLEEETRPRLQLQPPLAGRRRQLGADRPGQAQPERQAALDLQAGLVGETPRDFAAQKGVLVTQLRALTVHCIGEVLIEDARGDLLKRRTTQINR